ncbi:gliding motility-associated C-terminal domain-containing protein [Rhodocytophaga aerolata]|uniref:T9SS type B sorting domain-containing protein n=1 Tax=Rhodocytophaga aerolata TaxID=455078 RepID=UPI00360FFA8E
MNLAISQPQALAISLIAKADVTGCNGNTNGSITVGATGGTSNYTYSLDGVIFAASNTFNGLQAGIYNTITVKDANGCTAVLPAVTITQPDAIMADITGSNPTACSTTDGTITIRNISGGSGTFEFSIDGTTYQDETTFPGLPDGDYTITIRDKNNTTCFITKNWTLNSGSGFIATASSTAEITCGANDGTIIVTVNGGQAPFQYFIDGVINPDGAGNEVFSRLAPSTYTIQVVSNDGCSYTLSATVNACTPVCNLTAEAYSTPVLCDGVNNGTAILVNVSGGSGTYEYSVNSGVTYQNSPNFSSLAAGTYTILVRDKNNPSCTASFPVVVGKQFNVSGVIVVNNPEACQDRGSIEFRSVAGGTAPYTYSVDGISFSSTDVFPNLRIGMYPATIKDANGCTFTTTVEIKGATPLTANAVLSKPITCSTDANGEITITVNGGRSPYQYAINGASFAAGNGILTGLAAGTYTISVKDANNCITTLADVIITAPAAITASISDRTNPTCSSNSGSITVTANGGSGTLTYSIDNGATFVSNNSFTNLGEGAYSLMVKDANGCTVTLPVVTLTIPVITATINGSNPANCTTANGSITVNVTSDTAPYTYSLDGTTYQNEATFAGLTGGNYTVFIKDGAGCQISLTQDLTVAGGITAVTLNATAETACGANDGTITVGTITGAAGPYQYFIDGVLNSNGVFTGLAPKTYSIRVVAANGCIFTTSATVNNACVPTCDLTARIISSPVLCDGQANGTAELIEITGGSGRYAYSIDGVTFQDSPNFANLAAGTYTITVRDKNKTSCTASFTTTVTSKFNVSGIIVVTEPKTCNDKGSIEFTNVSGGTADYAFSVDGNTFGPNTMYANLDPGIYPATIRDANNCRFSVNITVRGVEPITATVTQSAPVSCSGENDGKIKIDNVKGGSGTFVYSLDGTTFSGTQEFTGLKGGDYTVYIKDQSENSTCINTFKVTVAEPAKMVIALTPKNPSTCSVSDGEISVQVTAGGVAPFTYKLNNGSFQTENTFTALSGGDYTVTVRSANGCTATFTQSLKVANAIAAKAEVVSSASCSGKQDGSARIFDVTGGSGTYEYSMDGITYQVSPLFTNLAANTYVLYVRDKNQTNGCTASYPVIVTEAAQIIADVTKKDPSTCTSTDGEITIGTVSGGTADYLYSLDNITFENRKTFSGMGNGTYTIYVKDSKGCVAQYTRTLASPNAVTVGIPTIVQPTCKGGTDGELTMNTVANGIAPYEYSMDGVIYQSSAKFTSLKAGKYTVRVKDASGCIYAFSYELSQPEGINYQIGNIATSACGEATGKVEITNISGGTAPYLFSIDGTNFQGSPVFEKLTAGQYELFIRDNTPSGCVVKDVFTIPGTTAITYKVDSVSIGCEGGNKGRIVVYGIKGGNKPYQVSLDNGSTWQFVQNDSIAYNDLAPKMYQLIIKYGASCQTAVRNINIYSGGLPVGVATTAATCGASNGSATAVMADASKKYFYSIDNNRFQESPVFLDLKAGKYTMYVRESANDLCPKQTEFTVAGPDSLTYDLEKVDCFDVRVLNIKGGTSPYRVSLDGGKTFVSGYIFPQSPNYLASNLAPGEYSIVVADDAGCSTVPVRVRIDNKITAKVTATLSLPDEPTGEIKITDIRGGNAPYEVSIDGRNWAVVKDKTLPVDTVITTQPMGKYVVYIRDANGCVKEYETEIKESKFTIPNIFTPNGDGVNDTFFIRNLPTGTFVTISNRWGKIIYTSNNYQNDWNGEGYAEGIYFYTVNIAAQGQFNGWVEIKR